MNKEIEYYLKIKELELKEAINSELLGKIYNYVLKKNNEIEHEVFKQRQLGVLTPKSNQQLLCEAKPYKEILNFFHEEEK